MPQVSELQDVSPRMTPNHLTLRGYMMVLVLAGVLPLLAYNLGSAYVGYKTERERATGRAMDLARGLSLSVEGELRGRIASLEVLSMSPTLAAGDIAAFRVQAEALVFRQLPGANILLLREDGQQIMNTALPPDALLPRRQSLANQRRVFATGQSSVSDVYLGVVLHRPIIAIDVPVRRLDGSVGMVLAMNPNIDAFDEVIRRQRPGEGWIVSVIDRAGIRIARQPDPSRYVGQQITPNFLQEWSSGHQEGIVEAISPEGMPVVTAYSRIAEVGWGVAVAVQTAELSGPAWRSALRSLLVGFVLLVLGLALTRWASLKITRPIAALRRLAASADEYGELAEVDRTGLRETDEVAEALRTEARRRRTAIASLLDSERRLRLVIAELNHRAKNALATVQSLAMQTARGPAATDPARFTQEFTKRIQSLARAHDLLTAFSWEAVALDAILRAGLAPWLDVEPRLNLVLHCDHCMTFPPAAPGQAQALVMAMHELATNAVKHGALSVPEGRVEVTCHRENGGLGAAIEWREIGGPLLTGLPPQQGFGTRLLERGLARDLGPGGSVSLDFHVDGVCAIIRFARLEVLPAL